ncbi:MAG TPA: ABC transporter ATP-binding protein [Methylomirabilota bacterium]|jgi:branched-chain amino acid transport system ATP-binding protein|nr:ABC transporter ATP-binding protein [Methylomirabilota bacterium]
MTLLAVSGLTKRFGGIVANRDISFEVRPGELVGVIGPNGSGKSTLFDLITGVTRPDAGRVALDGRDITSLRPDQICRLGVARTFQKLRPFHQMTALENVMIGALQRAADVGTARREAAEALASVGLAERAHARARALSTGQRKRLELVRALATRPRLLLLDEVTGGVDQGAIPGLIRLVRDLHARGLALVVIEHNMRVIMELAQRIVALQLGEVIAEGAPAEILRNPRVIDAYLGESWRPA